MSQIIFFLTYIVQKTFIKYNKFYLNASKSYLQICKNTLVEFVMSSNDDLTSYNKNIIFPIVLEKENIYLFCMNSKEFYKP